MTTAPLACTGRFIAFDGTQRAEMPRNDRWVSRTDLISRPAALAGDTQQRAFLAKNPLGKMLLLELDDGWCLSE